MRYSMLVYITNMGRTLLEAAQYLRTAPRDDLRMELLENGRQMLRQVQDVLESHKGDLHSMAPLTRLAEITSLWESGGDALERSLEQFVQALPGTVSYQVRAVFFAELGEKWDAMESVYEYMRDDSRFDPVVVRTPVGRVVKRDGKREQETIYRDFLTPMGIPSLGYDQYSIEEDCPDLAFISQPYESCTLPQFWPENIAKHTRLVYLLYYLPDVITKSHITTLAQLPVFRFAWKVPCPTEKQYNFYCRHAANGGANALMTGIPKTDPYVALRTRPVPMPESWMCLQGKTVFLWNSWYDITISSLRFFDSLLEWFEAHQDCGLIWRPHPMTDSVTKLYYPERYPVYQGYVQRALRAGNVVIDQESFCGAAFSASDAMISDPSSLVSQYLFIDKPVLWVKGQMDHQFMDRFIRTDWVEEAWTVEGIFSFIEQVCSGQDTYAAQRDRVWQQDIPLADGQCASRVCQALWHAMRQEDGLDGDRPLAPR